MNSLKLTKATEQKDFQSNKQTLLIGVVRKKILKTVGEQDKVKNEYKF